MIRKLAEKFYFLINGDEKLVYEIYPEWENIEKEMMDIWKSNYLWDINKIY